MQIMKKTAAIIIVFMFVLVACQKESLPYKFVSDTKPAGARTGQVAKTTDAVKPVAQNAPVSWDCKDSDYGDNTEAKGIVTGRNADGTTFSYEDECFGGILLENNCIDGKPESNKVRCERGCQNGFCI